MFLRRTPRTLSEKIRELLWPSMGWKRLLHYAQLRLIRIRDTTRSIAIGIAFGASISFTPLPGTHIVGAAALAYLARGNILASFAGTLIGNPWTFPLMWWASYKVGETAFHLFDRHVVQMPDQLTWDFLMDEVVHHPMDLIIPWAAGGIILMAFSWPIFYMLTYRTVAKLRHRHGQTHHDRKKG